MKKNKSYYWIFAVLCIETNIDATPISSTDTRSSSFSSPLMAKSGAKEGNASTMDTDSVEFLEEIDGLGSHDDASQPTASVLARASDQDTGALNQYKEPDPKEEREILPEPSSHASDIPQLNSVTGIRTWLESTALPVFQNAKNYTTDNLIPQAQEITQTVAQQAKETGKTIIDYMNSTFVPKLKDLASTVGHTLISWAETSEAKHPGLEAEDTKIETQPSQEAPII